MGDAYDCPECGLHCGTHLALSKHEKKCPAITKYQFYERHEKKGVKCPVCLETWRDFWKRGEDWVCLQCGCVFVPKDEVEKANKILEGRRAK